MQNLIKASDLKPPISMEKITEHLNKIIVSANESGKKNVRTYGLNGEFGSGDLYNGNTPLVNDVIAALRVNGFRAKICFDMKQFVDIYLYIEWD